MTNERTIQRRVDASRKRKFLKDYYYRLRMFFAGNYSSIMPGGQDTTATGGLPTNSIEKANWPDTYMNQAFEAGSNFTMSVILTLMELLYVPKPDIRFPKLSTQVSVFREEYLLDRLEKAKWGHEQLTSILDFLINGITCWHVNTNAQSEFSGYPMFVRIDPLNLFLDPLSKYPNQSRFVAILWEISPEEAEAKLGPNYAQLIEGGDAKLDEERPIKVIEYWDKDTRALLHPGSSKVIFIEDSPTPGELPFVFFHNVIPPSQLCPLPHVMQMVGSQVAHNETQKMISEISKMMKPFIQMDQTAFTPDSIARFEQGDGDVNVLILQDPSRPGITITQPAKLSPDLVGLLGVYEKALTQSGQFDPYTLGASQDVEFAREVSAIQAAAGLFVRHSARELSHSLGLLFRMMIKMGAQYDKEPFEFDEEGLEILFNERPEDFPEGEPFFGRELETMLGRDVPVEVSVSPFETPQSRAAMATTIMDIATKSGTQTPQLMRRMMEIVLSAQGETDIDKLLSPDGEALKMELVKDLTIEQLQQILVQFAQAQQAQQDQQAQQPQGQQALPGPQVPPITQ